MIGWAVIGYIVWGLAVHWVPVLRFIGYAFVCGAASSVVTVFLLVGLVVRRNSVDDGSYQDPRPLAFLAPQRWHGEVEAAVKRRQYRPTAIHPQSPAISASLDRLLELVRRDFVTSWYSNISPDSSFGDEVDKMLRAVLVDLRARCLEVDMVQIAVARVVPIITEHLKDFSLAERLVRGKQLERRAAESQELDLAIARRYRDGKLHSAVTFSVSEAKAVQQRYLRTVVEKVVVRALPPQQTRSQAVVVLIREIVTCAVTVPIVQLGADPDTWNQLIETYVRTARLPPWGAVSCDVINRAGRCCKIESPSAGCVPRWTSMPLPGPNLNGVRPFRGWLLVTVSATLSGSSAWSGNATTYPAPGVYAARSPASWKEMRRWRHKTRSI